MFTTTVGTPFESHNLRRDFRKVTAAAGLGSRWVPKELRTSFVSMMSYQGVPVEEIARLAGHASSRTTEVIYRRELRPVITTGAEVMDQIFRHRHVRPVGADAAGEPELHFAGEADDLFDDESIPQSNWVMPDVAGLTV